MSEVGSNFPRLPQVAGYDVLREIGRGGVAVVYLAEQLNLERLVALKEVSQLGPTNPELASRFLDESRLAGKLNHRNIVTVHDYFEHGGTPYLSMEYLARGSLRPLVGRLNAAQTIGVLTDVLAGLTAAHARRIVHRDLKPENLLVTDDGHVKITDFGIAKAVDRLTGNQSKTDTIGTPTYMAPEQAMGQPVAPVTDLYSLGVVAYELTVGMVPFEADTPVSLLLRHVHDAPRPPRSVKPDLDPEFAEWIERLLIKSPEERTPTAGRASEELEEIAFRLLGRRWPREAALPELVTDPDRSGFSTYDPRPAPSTAPEERAPRASEPMPSPRAAEPEREAAPQIMPDPVADLVTVPPRRPADAVEPEADREREPVPPRRRVRMLAAAVGLLSIAIAVGVGVYVSRPDDGAPATPAPRARETMRFTTRAFTMQAPAGWTVECRDNAETCAQVELPINVHRSALSGGAGAGLSVDRTPLRDDPASVSLTEIITRVRRELARANYSVDTPPQAVTFDGRKMRRLSLVSDAGTHGTVYAFKADGDAYVITVTGSDRAASQERARIAATSLRPI